MEAGKAFADFDCFFEGGGLAARIRGWREV
jgi:hypothetical protein